ncbi:MAG: cyclopropane-fatty-acyl-phospholipid synthase family protein [Planctomycetota bacterium]
MNASINGYYDRARIDGLVAEGQHRAAVGGLWDEIGRLQFDFVVSHGLTPTSRVLDVGCGCLRGGVHFIRHLEPGHYFGIDLSESLLQAGYDVELAALGLQHKLPRGNLIATDSFDPAPFGVTFDVLIAQSVFTHLPLNHIRLCLARTAPFVREGGRFFATFFLCATDAEWMGPRPVIDGITTWPASDPYHYTADHIAWCAHGLPWNVTIVGDWNHPRRQSMVIFERQPA